MKMMSLKKLYVYGSFSCNLKNKNLLFKLVCDSVLNFDTWCAILFPFIALFYYILANIHPKHRSSLKTIQLIAVVRYPLLKEYGFEAVLKRFINDMNKLGKVFFCFVCGLVIELEICRDVC